MSCAHWRMPVIVGLGLGLASALAPGALFLAGLACVIGLALYRSAEPADRRFLVALFLGSFLLRVVLSLGLDLGSLRAEGLWPAKTAEVTEWSLGVTDVTRQYLKMGDSDYNSERGYALDQFVRGHREEPIVLLRLKQNRPHGTLYVIGLFYHFFGFSPISVKWINGLAGALLGAVVFLLARSISGSSVARTASVLASFFPSMLLWSVTNLKEPSFILLAAVLLLLAVKIRQASRLRPILLYGTVFALILGAHTTLRSDAGFSWLLAGCVLLSFPLSWMKSRWQLPAFALLPAALWAAVVWIPAASEKLSFVFYRHIGNVYQDQTSMTYSYLPFSLDSNFWAMGLEKWAAMIRNDPRFLLQSVGRAVFHYLLEPLPERTGDLFTLTVLPQMILWYGLLPCAAWGMWVALRRYPQGSPFLLTTAVAWTIAGGLAAGNVGLVFRVRDMVTPLFLIFSSIGIQSCLERLDRGVD